MSTVEFGSAPFVGWRCWKLMLPAYIGDANGTCIWDPQTRQDAYCRFNDRAFQPHDAPQLDCTCGIHAARTLDDLLRMGYTRGYYAVVGTVALWGKVVECENGFRAQFAYPTELFYNFKPKTLNNQAQELVAADLLAFRIGMRYGVACTVRAFESDQMSFTPASPALVASKRKTRLQKPAVAL